jgi:hypothetical protein
MKVIPITVLACLITIGAVSLVHSAAPPDERIRNAYKQVLLEADKNKDGKLLVTECKTMFKDKVTGEANCGFWDANHDGVIMEDEYVSQVKSLMRNKK